jgi:hypothetical protein
MIQKLLDGKFLKENFGQSTIIQDQNLYPNSSIEHSFTIAFLQVVHVLESVTVGTQMIFNRLIVSNICSIRSKVSLYAHEPESTFRIVTSIAVIQPF